MRHFWLRLAAVTLLVLVASFAGILLAWEAGYLRASFIRFVSWQIGRPFEVRGALHVHLFTARPSIEAEQVTIHNPPWTKPGITAEVAKLTATFGPLLSRQSGLESLKLDTAKLYFMRDAAGRANWQRTDPDTSAGEPLPMIKALELTHTHLTLTDERLHLAYDGELSVVGPNSALPFEISGAGTLNQHSVSFRLKGDALPSASPDKPYAFEFDERSSGTYLTGHGSLPRPFDVRLVNAEFDARGADLRDLYYLAGVSLPNTGMFQLGGRFTRRDDETRFDDLKMVSGESDVNGSVSLTTQKNGRTLLQVNFSSALLRLADLGLRAAGRDPHPDAPPKLFSAVQLITPAMRTIDVHGYYNAHRLLLSRVEVSQLSAPFTIEHGVIKAPEITGHFLGGHFVLQLEADANQTPAHTRIEINSADLQLAQMPTKSEPPPYAGSLQLTIRAQGIGDSLHAVAAAAEGTMSARFFAGALRASLAEMIGVDLRGLGLTLTRSDREVPVRCAAADFAIHGGVMHSTRFFIDSGPVFITGEGQVLLDSETLDLRLHGEPKELRLLRLKAPILVQGTLLQPQFKVDTAGSKFQLVDRGKPREGDCGALQSHDAGIPGAR